MSPARRAKRQGVVGAACVAIGLHVAGVVTGAVAADPVAASPAVELPPMLVEESVSSVPWLYVNAGGVEFLSRCSAYTTRQLAEAWLNKLQMIRVLVPGEFLARMEVPAVFVLYAQDLQQTVSVEIQREMQTARASEPDRGGDPNRAGGVSIAPSMRLTDRDMSASIAYIDEALFDASTLSISPNHVRFLLRGRVPELPGWLIEGVERTYRRADFVEDPITVGPAIWLNSMESEALASDRHHPRAVLPASDLFAPEGVRAAESRHPRRVQARASTQELFVRWAIVSGGATREAFWKFAARAAEHGVTEGMFEASFGFGFSELRDRLSDYLPKAVEEFEWIEPGRLPPLPRIEVERATPNQIARVRGEWERLAIGHVQRRLPQVREPYLAQARRTLRRAYDTGDRDPRLLATMGLCEVDAGNDTGALAFLEPAVALGVIRPRAYYELARLRWSELTRTAPAGKRFSYGELAPVVGPLRRALTQAPPLPEVFALLGEAWAQCEMMPNTTEFAELELGARLFPRRAEVALPLARALAWHGRNPEAVAVVDACMDHASDEDLRAGLTRLRAELKSAPAGALTR